MIKNLNDSNEYINASAKSTILQNLDFLSPDIDPELSKSILDDNIKNELSNMDSLPNATIDLCNIKSETEISIPKTDICELPNIAIKTENDIKSELLTSGTDIDDILKQFNVSTQDSCVDTYIDDLKKLSESLYKESLKLDYYYNILNNSLDYFIKYQFSILLKSYFLIYLSKSENKTDILDRIKSKIKTYTNLDKISEYSDNIGISNLYSKTINLLSKYSETNIDPNKKNSEIIDITVFLNKNVSLNSKHNIFLFRIDEKLFSLNLDHNKFNIKYNTSKSAIFDNFFNIGFKKPEENQYSDIIKFFIDNRQIRTNIIDEINIDSYSEFLKLNMKDYVEYYNTTISYKISDSSIYTDIENSLYEDLENSNILYETVFNSLESINKIQDPSYIKKKILNIKKCGGDIIEPIQTNIDIIENLSKQGESSYSESDITKIAYWQQYAKYLTLTSLALPNTWSIGLILPNGSRIPLPTAYIAITAFYFAPILTVVFITINGVVVLPTIYQIHQIPLDESKSLILFGTKGSNISIRQKKTGNEILNLPVVKGINLNPIEGLVLPFKKDDLPILERMSLKNIVFLNYLKMWITNISSFMGL